MSIKSEKDVETSILEEYISELPSRKLEIIFDEDEANIVFNLAIKFGFTKIEIMILKLKQGGGGKPHERFVDMLLCSDKTISDISDALEELKMDDAVEVLDDILHNNKEYEDFSDLQPHEASLFHKYLIEDPRNKFVTCWVDLAEQLGMTEIIKNIEATKSQGFKYSAASGLFEYLIAQDKKIRDLQRKLKEVQEDPDMLPAQRAMDALDDAVKQLVQTKKEELETHGYEERKKKR